MKTMKSSFVNRSRRPGLAVLTARMLPVPAAFSILPLACLLLAVPSTGGAQSTCRVYCPDGTSFIQECSSNVDPCVSSGVPGNPGGGYTPQPPADPGIKQRRRYQAMIQRGLVDDAAFAKAPISTDDQFASVLGSLHTHLSRTVVLSNARRRYYDAQASAEWTKYRDYYSVRFALLDASDGLVPDLRADNLAERRRFEEVDREKSRLESVVSRFAASGNGPLQQSGLLLREEALTAKLRVLAHLGGLTPFEVEAAVESIMPEIPEESPVVVPVRTIPWYLASIYLPHPSHQQAIDEAKESLDRAQFRGYPVIGGNIDSRLSLCETMAEEAAAAQKASREAASTYKDGVDKNARAAKHWEISAQANMRLWTETQGLRYAAAKAESALERTREVFKSYTWKCLVDSSRGLAWKAFRKALLDPELQRLSLELFDGKAFLHGDDEIRAAWRLGTPLVAPAISAYARIKEVRSLRLLTKKLNATIEENILAAADLLVSADSATSTEFYGSVFSGADAEIRAEVRSVLSETSLPPAFQRSWQGYFVGGN